MNIDWQEAEKKNGAAKEDSASSPALKGAMLPLRRAGHADQRQQLRIDRRHGHAGPELGRRNAQLTGDSEGGHVQLTPELSRVRSTSA